MSETEEGAKEAIFASQLSTAEGVAIIVVNIAVIAILSSNGKMRERYLLLVALSLADTLGGISSLANGLNTIKTFDRWPDLPENMTVRDCFTAPDVFTQLIGWEWHATITLAIGVERFIAVFKPVYYRAKFTPFHRFSLALTGLLLVLGNVIVMYVHAWLFRLDLKSYYVCYLGGVLGAWASDVQWGFVIVADTIGFLLSLLAYLNARKKSRVSGEVGAHMREEIKRVNLYLIISGMSVLLVVLPGIILTLHNRMIYTLPHNAGYYVGHVYKLNYGSSLFVHLLFNRDFRSQLIYLASWGRVRSNTISTYS